MKTTEQAAIQWGYSSSEGYDNPNFNQSVESFTAGVKFAQEWISVEDEMPEIKDKRYQIHVKYKSGIDIYDTIAIEPSICTKDNLYHILKEFKIAYWRTIERK